MTTRLLLALYLTGALVAGARAEGPDVVLPAGIIPSTVLPAEHAYVVSVYIGTPPEEVKLEVRFDAAGVWLTRDQAIHSASHVVSDGGSESDIVYFGGTRRRVVIRRGSPRTLGSPRLCGECEGVLGLRGDSDIWKWWPDAAFTPASVTLGGRSPPVIFAEDDLHTWELPCENSDSDEGALCVVDAEWNGVKLRAVIMPHASHTIAPRHVVSAYLEGKNLYDDANDWDPFDLEFTGDVVHEGGASLLLSLGRDELSGQHGAEARELLIDTGRDNHTVVVGSALLRRFALYRSADRSKIILHAHPVFTNLPHANSLLFLAAFCIFVRWKLTDLGRHYAREPRQVAVTIVDMVYQVVGQAIALVALGLPSTWAVMLDSPSLHNTSIAIVVVGIIFTAAMRAALFRIQANARRANRPLSRVRPSTFLLVLVESVWHEAVLITAMWILVAPRRRENLAGPLTAIAGAAAVYSFTVHLTFLAVFTIVQFGTPRKGNVARPPPLTLVVVAYLSVVGLIAFFGTLFVWVFMLPALINLAGIYYELVYGASAGTAAFVVLLAVCMTDTYIEQAVRLSAKQHHDARVEEEKRYQERETPGQFAQRWDPYNAKLKQ